MDNPPVTVTVLPADDKSGTGKPKSALGGAPFESVANDLLQKTAALSTVKLRLDWDGSKIPRGALLPTKEPSEVCWTQHGRVSAKSPRDNHAFPRARDVGTYERIVSWGGPEGKTHQMIIHLHPSECPGGGTRKHTNTADMPQLAEVLEASLRAEAGDEVAEELLRTEAEKDAPTTHPADAPHGKRDHKDSP